MKKGRLLCTLWSFASVWAHATDADLQKLQGRWVMAPELQDVVAINCQSLSLDIDASNLTLRSGALVLVTRYEVETPGPRFSLRRTVVSNNGQKNCYGAQLPEAAGQHINNLRIDWLGDRLRVYERSSRGSERSFDMVRSAK